MKPGDYELGSGLSRAAARTLLERRHAQQVRLTVILDAKSYDQPQLGKWREWKDGSLIRTCCLPVGMSIHQAERVVSQMGTKPIRQQVEQLHKSPLVPEW